MSKVPLDKLTIHKSDGLTKIETYGIPDQLIVGPPHLVFATDPVPLDSAFLNLVFNSKRPWFSAEFVKWSAFSSEFNYENLWPHNFFVSIIRSNRLLGTLVGFPL